MGQTLGWLNRLAMSASRLKRSTAAGSAERCAASTLMATRPPDVASAATYTAAIPPSPIRRSTWNRPSSTVPGRSASGSSASRGAPSLVQNRAGSA